MNVCTYINCGGLRGLYNGLIYTCMYACCAGCGLPVYADAGFKWMISITGSRCQGGGMLQEGGMREWVERVIGCDLGSGGIWRCGSYITGGCGGSCGVFCVE